MFVELSGVNVGAGSQLGYSKRLLAMFLIVHFIYNLSFFGMLVVYVMDNLPFFFRSRGLMVYIISGQI